MNKNKSKAGREVLNRESLNTELGHELADIIYILRELGLPEDEVIERVKIRIAALA